MRFSKHPPPLGVPGYNFYGSREAGGAIQYTGGAVGSEVEITSNIHSSFKSHSHGMHFWRPPHLELISVTELVSENSSSNALGEGEYLTHACNMYAEYNWRWAAESKSSRTEDTTNIGIPILYVNGSKLQEWLPRPAGALAQVQWRVTSLQMGWCLKGIYRLVARAVPDADMAAHSLFMSSLAEHREKCWVALWALHPQTLQSRTSAENTSSPLQAHSTDCAQVWEYRARITSKARLDKRLYPKSRSFNVASHGVFRLKMLAQPSEEVETLVFFSSSVRIISNSEASLNGVWVTCWLEEESVRWAGVSETAFDSGGYSGQFQPLRNMSNVTDDSGVATFVVRLTRGDPSRRIRLRYTALPLTNNL